MLSHGILIPRKMGGQVYWALGNLKFSPTPPWESAYPSREFKTFHPSLEETRFSQLGGMEGESLPHWPKIYSSLPQKERSPINTMISKMQWSIKWTVIKNCFKTIWNSHAPFYHFILKLLKKGMSQSLLIFVLSTENSEIINPFTTELIFRFHCFWTGKSTLNIWNFKITLANHTFYES